MLLKTVQAGKGPTRRQGSGQKEPQSSKQAKKASREIHKGMPSGGFQSTPKGDKGYNRKSKHKNADYTVGEELTPVDETYRGINFPMASTLNWNEDISTARPCGEDEMYPEKCGDGAPYSQQTGNPDRSLNDYDRKWYDMDDFLSNAGSTSELLAKGKASGLHGTDTEQLIENLTAQQIPNYEGDEILQEHYMNKWQKANPDPYKSTARVFVEDLNWSTHKAETFDDTGKDGKFPAWGLKSIIDRGVSPHETPKADKQIKLGEPHTQKRTEDKNKNFKAYSMTSMLKW